MDEREYQQSPSSSSSSPPGICRRLFNLVMKIVAEQSLKTVTLGRSYEYWCCSSRSIQSDGFDNWTPYLKKFCLVGAASEKPCLILTSFSFFFWCLCLAKINSIMNLCKNVNMQNCKLESWKLWHIVNFQIYMVSELTPPQSKSIPFLGGRHIPLSIAPLLMKPQLLDRVRNLFPDGFEKHNVTTIVNFVRRNGTDTPPIKVVRINPVTNMKHRSLHDFRRQRADLVRHYGLFQR